MNNKFYKYALLAILSSPVDAYANAGLPMITIGYPFMITLFVPVLLIEIIVYKVKLDKGYWSAFKVAGLANLYTTIVGYPISWFLLLIYQLLALIIFSGVAYVLPENIIENHVLSVISIPLIMPAWIAPFYDYPVDLIICLAGMVGLIPAYWITVTSELTILHKFWGQDEKVDSVCIFANRLSYLFLYLVLIILFFYSLIT